MTADDPAERDDLVEPDGVNAGSAPAERDDDTGDGAVPATASPIDVPPPHRHGDEMVGLPGQPDDGPGQQMEAGEG